MNMKVAGYWASTALVAFAMGTGGVADFMRIPDAVEGMRVLGYPAYFLTIIGVWKVLGAIAILAPRFPLLKEWAYAGIFFDLSGAAASHAASGDFGAYAFQIFVPLFLVLLTIASWALRPASRTISAGIL